MQQSKKISKNKFIVPQEIIEGKILFIRKRKVMLDRDLAKLYEVSTKALNQAVKRNIERFPDLFMFQLNKEEFENWRSQFVTSKREKMGIRRRPYAFTEQGVAMLSSVLKSKRAIQVNIQIMITFTKIREILTTHKDILRKVEKMEKKYDQQFKVVFDAIRQLLATPKKPKKEMGFHTKT